MSESLRLGESVRSLIRKIQSIQLGLDSGDEKLPAQIAQLQPEFQKIMAMVSAADLTFEAEQRLQPYQTEAHRRLRLLSVSAMKLRTAKQVETLQGVRSQIKDHLIQLQKFAEAMVTELGDPS